MSDAPGRIWSKLLGMNVRVDAAMAKGASRLEVENLTAAERGARRREADAYRAGLEAAAKVAESRVAPDAHPNSIAAFMSKDIAAAIRDMKGDTP
jgi:hypothetical protein